MRVLTLGIWAEGPTDSRFLSPLLDRLSVKLLRDRGRARVQVAAPILIGDRLSRENFPVVAGACDPSVSILVVHTDAGGDVERAFAERIRPWFASVADEFQEGERELVPVVPVRETEAWLLCDIDALNQVFGMRKDRSAFGLPRHAREVEQITDPKAHLRQAQIYAIGKRPARKAGLGALYSALGVQVSFEELEKVLAFRQFAAAFEQALQRLGFLRPPPTRARNRDLS